MWASSAGGTARVSVIMPVFNGVQTVGAAIESVRAQTLLEWELLVVDDGSSDGSASVVKALEAGSRLRLICQEHQGLSVARNRGIEEAGGDLLAFLDADDLWTPGYLAAMSSALAERPAVALAFGSWQYVDERGELLPQRVTPYEGDPERARAELPWRNAIVPSAAVARTAALRRTGGFDCTFEICADWELWLRLLDDGAIVAVPAALAFYRARAGSLSDTPAGMEAERLRLNEKRHGAAVGDPARWPFERRRAVGHTLFVSGVDYLRRGEDELGRTKIRAALEAWPGLADEDELYYELACARQPRGRRGPSPALDLLESARLIEWVVPNRGGGALPARASLALGTLGLFSGERRTARRHARAALCDGGWRDRRRAFGLLVAASIPAQLSSRLRAWRQERLQRARAGAAIRAEGNRT